MIKHFVNTYSSSFISRWAILLLDAVTVAVSFLVTYLIWFKFNYLALESTTAMIQLGVTTLVYVLSFLIIGSYSGIIRHTALSDVFRLLKAITLAFIVLIGINVVFYLLGKASIYRTSYSVLIIHFLLSLFFLVGSRVIIKLLFIQITRQYAKEKIPVLIYGAGTAGMLTKNALVNDKNFRYEVVAYIDDNPSKVSKRLEGIPVVTQYRALRTSYIKITTF